MGEANRWLSVSGCHYTLHRRLCSAGAPLRGLSLENQCDFVGLADPSPMFAAEKKGVRTSLNDDYDDGRPGFLPWSCGRGHCLAETPSCDLDR